MLELLSPRLSWAEAWTRLQEHLSHFREYRIGHVVEPLAWMPDTDENTLADILFRAIGTTSIELTRMARAAAVELNQTRGGSALSPALLTRLWRVGGQHAFEAAHIAWECKDIIAIRDAVVPWLSEMADSNDYAVRRTAVSLARSWEQQPKIKRGKLPALYELELPPNPQASRFEPPSGISSVSSGLWTEDAYAWTWPLEDALRMTVTSTGLELQNIRARAAQLMTRMGGADAFGPEAVACQQRRFRRLSLHVAYRKLGTSAAFLANA